MVYKCYLLIVRIVQFRRLKDRLLTIVSQMKCQFYVLMARIFLETKGHFNCLQVNTQRPAYCMLDHLPVSFNIQACDCLG